MPSATAPRLRLIGAAALFSTGGAAIKACSLDGFQVACLRSGIAAVTILLLLPASRRAWRVSTLAIGATYATTLILFVLANKLTTSASTIFLQSTAPLYVLLLSPWLLREPVRRRDVVFMAALAVGMSTFFIGIDPASDSAPDPSRGNIFGLLAGVFWAVTIIGLRWSARGTAGEPRGGEQIAVVVFAGNALAFLACLPAAWPFAAASPADWAVVAYLGVFQIGVAYILIASGLRDVPALEASLLLLIEPVLNPVWSWMAHGEVPGPWAMAGGAVILSATALRTWTAARRARLPEPGR